MGSTLLRDADCTPLLPTVIANHFLLLRVADQYVGFAAAAAAAAVAAAAWWQFCLSCCGQPLSADCLVRTSLHRQL
jgi:hypothetical protein